MRLIIILCLFVLSCCSADVDKPIDETIIDFSNVDINELLRSNLGVVNKPLKIDVYMDCFGKRHSMVLPLVVNNQLPMSQQKQPLSNILQKKAKKTENSTYIGELHNYTFFESITLHEDNVLLQNVINDKRYSVRLPIISFNDDSILYSINAGGRSGDGDNPYMQKIQLLSMSSPLGGKLFFPSNFLIELDNIYYTEGQLLVKKDLNFYDVSEAINLCSTKQNMFGDSLMNTGQPSEK